MEGRANLLVAEGHQYARQYHLGWVLFQSTLGSKRINSRLAAEAALRRHSVWGEQADFQKIVEGLSDG